MKEKEVVCPVCWGEKKLTQGEMGRDESGNPYYSIAWRAKCSTCHGKGKGDFNVTPEQIWAVLDRMERAQRRDGKSPAEIGKNLETARLT